MELRMEGQPPLRCPYQQPSLRCRYQQLSVLCRYHQQLHLCPRNVLWKTTTRPPFLRLSIQIPP